MVKKLGFAIEVSRCVLRGRDVLQERFWGLFLCFFFFPGFWLFFFFNIYLWIVTTHLIISSVLIYFKKGLLCVCIFIFLS